MDDGVVCGHYIAGALMMLLFLICIVPGMASITPDFYIKNQDGMVDVQFPAGDSLSLYNNSVITGEEILLWNWTITNEMDEVVGNSDSENFLFEDSAQLPVGTYTVTFRVIGNVTHTPPPPPAVGNFTLTDDLGIDANFTYAVNYEQVIPSVTLIDLSQSSHGLVNRWYWYVAGADIYSTVQTPVFPAGEGQYTVYLTIVDDSGHKKSVSKDIIIDKDRNERGITFSYVQEPGNSPYDIQFVPEQIGTDWNITWDFGDGSELVYYTVNDETTQNWSPYHTYPPSQELEVQYNVTMTIEKAGKIISVSKIVSLFGDGVTFSYGQEPGNSPFEIKFVPEEIGTDWNISWDFGDGSELVYYSVDDETTWNWSPYHTYPSATNYTEPYFVTMVADKGSKQKTASNYVDVVPYIDDLPDPIISVVPEEAGSAPGVPTDTPITFSCVNPDSWEDSWFWDFGDGTSTPIRTPDHAYTTPGIYDVKLRAGNLHGETPGEIQVFICNSATIIDANATPDSGNFPLTVQFTANASVNGKTAEQSKPLIKGWTWDFGEMDEMGSPILSTDQNPVHTYNKPGVYYVSVFCTLYDGSTSDTYTLAIPITVGPDPYADFYWEAISTDDSSSHYGYKFTDTSISSSDLSYLWDFNDGYTSDNQNPTHFYREPGVYDVTLTVTNSTDLASDSTTETIVVTPEGNPATTGSSSGFQDAGFTYVNDDISAAAIVPVPLEAKFLVNGQKVPVPISSPSTVTFTDLSTGWPTSWFWEFGDGQTSNLQNPTHTYQYPGRYMPKLTVSNLAGNVDDYQVPSEIVVQYGEPVITAEANITQGIFPLAVQFTASATVDGFDVSSSKDIIKEWTWVFGDLDDNGWYAVSHEQNPVYVYEKPGLYPVNVTCTLQDGVSKTVDIPIRNGVVIPGSSNIITINPLPLANYYWEYLDYDETCCYLVKFTDASVINRANDPHQRLWVFDDGAQSTETNPTHRFKEAGNFNVSLTVADIHGNVNSIVKTVPITEGYEQPDNPRSYDTLTADFVTVVGLNSKTINFLDNSKGKATQWIWDFGDGNSAVISGSGGNVVHTYQKFGSYDVKLTVSSPIFTSSVVKTIGIR